MYQMLTVHAMCRGGDFRPAYSKLDSVTAQLPCASVALTAPSAIDEICKSLCVILYA